MNTSMKILNTTRVSAAADRPARRSGSAHAKYSVVRIASYRVRTGCQCLRRRVVFKRIRKKGPWKIGPRKKRPKLEKKSTEITSTTKKRPVGNKVHLQRVGKKGHKSRKIGPQHPNIRLFAFYILGAMAAKRRRWYITVQFVTVIAEADLFDASTVCYLRTVMPPSA